MKYISMPNRPQSSPSHIAFIDAEFDGVNGTARRTLSLTSNSVDRVHACVASATKPSRRYRTSSSVPKVPVLSGALTNSTDPSSRYLVATGFENDRAEDGSRDLDRSDDTRDVQRCAAGPLRMQAAERPQP